MYVFLPPSYIKSRKSHVLTINFKSTPNAPNSPSRAPAPSSPPPPGSSPSQAPTPNPTQASPSTSTPMPRRPQPPIPFPDPQSGMERAARPPRTNLRLRSHLLPRRLRWIRRSRRAMRWRGMGSVVELGLRGARFVLRARLARRAATIIRNACKE